MRDVIAVQLLHNITMLCIDVECVCSHSNAHQRVEAHRVQHTISCRVGRRKTVVYITDSFVSVYAKSSVRVGRHGRLPLYLYTCIAGRPGVLPVCCLCSRPHHWTDDLRLAPKLI